MGLEIQIVYGMAPMMMRNFGHCKTIKIGYNYLICIIKFYVKVI